jgi:hypothetical protein
MLKQIESLIFLFLFVKRSAQQDAVVFSSFSSVYVLDAGGDGPLVIHYTSCFSLVRRLSNTIFIICR